MQRNVVFSVVLALTAGSVLLAGSPFQDPQEVAAKEKAAQADVVRLQGQVLAERAKLLENIKVNGKALDPRAVMRECVYLTGGKLVESRVADFFIIEEMEKQIQAGRDPAEFAVSDEDVEGELATMRTDFEVKNPGVDFWEVVRSQYGLTQETFLQQRKQASASTRSSSPATPPTGR